MDRPTCNWRTYKRVVCGKPGKFTTRNGYVLCKMHGARWNARQIKHISASSAPIGGPAVEIP
jgi:hypothetical protein